MKLSNNTSFSEITVDSKNSQLKISRQNVYTTQYCSELYGTMSARIFVA